MCQIYFAKLTVISSKLTFLVVADPAAMGNVRAPYRF